MATWWNLATATNRSLSDVCVCVFVFVCVFVCVCDSRLSQSFTLLVEDQVKIVHNTSAQRQI